MFFSNPDVIYCLFQVVPTASQWLWIYFERKLVTQEESNLREDWDRSSVENTPKWTLFSMCNPVENRDRLLREIEDLRVRITELERSRTKIQEAERQLENELAVRTALAELSRSLIASAPLDDICLIVLTHAKNLTGSLYGFVGYIEPSTGYLISPTLTRDIWEKKCGSLDKTVVFREFSGLWGWVLNSRKPLSTNNPWSDPRSTGTPEGHIPIRRFLSVPAMSGDKLVGQIALANAERDYTKDDLEVVERLARLYALAVQREQDAQELLTAKEEAEQASRAKSEFLSRMSHELRTPLNAVLGFAQLLETDPVEPLTASQQESVQHILRSGYHLLDLINRVLDLSQIESGRLLIEVEPVPLSQVLDETMEVIAPLAERYGVTVNLRVEQYRTVVMKANRTRLKQVFINLASNAVQYNKPGGTVTITCEKSAPHAIRINLCDTGPGIPPDRWESIFDPFTRLNEKESVVDGPGIGLTISKRLIELMGGTIGLQSAPGQGSCFHVVLPIADEYYETGDIVSKTIPASERSTPVYLRTILYFEDNPEQLALVASLLSRRPQVKLLSSPQSKLGIELARAHRPDMILLDLSLPDMNGLDLVRSLRAYPETREIPVVALSTNTLPEEIRRAKEAGFQDYLTKPINVNEFLDYIDRMLIAEPDRSIWRAP